MRPGGVRLRDFARKRPDVERYCEATKEIKGRDA